MFDALQGIFSDPLTRKLAIVSLGIAFITALSYVIRHSLARRIDSIDGRYRLRKVTGFINAIVVMMIVTIAFSDRLGNLAVAFGVAGAGIAFALQEVIASIAGWVAVSAGNFYSVGDRVQLGGIAGDVIDIGVLRTTIMETGQWVKGDLYNGRIVRVANSFVFKEPVYNYSGDFPFLWDEITVPVKHGSDHHLAREILQRIADESVGVFAEQAQVHWQAMVHKYRIEEARIAPMVTLIANDNWLEFTVRYVVDYKQRRRNKDILFTGILDAFECTEGKVSLASATFHLVEAPTLNVRIAGKDG